MEKTSGRTHIEDLSPATLKLSSFLKYTYYKMHDLNHFFKCTVWQSPVYSQCHATTLQHVSILQS